MLTAITRAVGAGLDACELTYLTRESIDTSLAQRQHQAYEDCLRALGVEVISLPAAPDLPDAVFVEDTAVVVDELAVLTLPGAASRRGEVETVAATMAPFRSLRSLHAPATLEGGDVLRIGRTLFVGASTRTNATGIAQLQTLLGPFDYDVQSVMVTGCLHLKTGVTYLGNHTLLANPAWVDTTQLTGYDVLPVPDDEPWGANTLTIGDITLLPAGFPRTRALLEARGFTVRVLDISELRKAEAGLTCLSIIFNAAGPDQS